VALKSRSLLGIELHEHEIRVVELRFRGNDTSIATLTTYIPEEGYLGEWGVTDPQALGAQLKSALHQAGVNTSEAAFGLPAWACLVRPMALPPVVEKEMHFIVQGEVEHMQLFREPGASFDIVRLSDSKLLESSGRNILFAGCEMRILESIRNLAKAAGLKLAAVEPTHSALYRLAYSQVTGSPNLFVTLSETHAQIYLLDKGELALHRTFDLGGSIFDVEEPEDGSLKPYFDIDAASTLAVELRRSIDFIARELPESPRTETIHLACTHADAAVLSHWLESALQVSVQVADIRKTNPGTRPMKGAAENDSNRYVGAYGLALRDPALLPKNVPVIDLFANEHVRIGVQEDGRRKFRLAMAASIVLLACGGITAALGTVRAREAADDLVKSEGKLAQTKEMERVKSEEAAHREERLRLLSADGVPVRSVITSIVRAIPNDVGLVEVKMSPTNADVAGETLSEASIIRMSDTLRNDPRFAAVSLTWFERVNAAVAGSGMRFRMNMITIPPTPAPPAPGTSGTTTAMNTTQANAGGNRS
jgi:Tfp pilus assembly PilM family ATPase